MFELKPCPFCGSGAKGTTDKEWTQDMNASIPHTVHYIQCTKCGARSRELHIWHDSDEELTQLKELVEDWNTRTGEPRRCCQNCKWSDPLDVNYCRNTTPCDNCSAWEAVE